MNGEAIPDGVWRATNRALWDGWAAAHADGGYDLDGVVAGAKGLRPWEYPELGNIAGLDVIHLQCHLGSDTVALARLGARVVGLDFSPVALEAARALATRCAVDISWVEADVHDAPSAAGAGRFDLVYTGLGALSWLPDLSRWANVVAELLKPGGALYLVEIHPMAVALGDDGVRLGEDAIGAAFQRWSNEGEGSYAAPTAVFEHTASYERLHGTGELLSALLDAGFVLEMYHELDVTPCPTPWLERGSDGLYRFASGAFRFPLTYSLRARRS